MFDLPQELVSAQLGLPLELAHVFLVFDLHQLHLVVFLLVELRDGLLLEVHLLQVLVLVVVLLVQQLLHLGTQGSILGLELPHLDLQRFVVLQDG